MAGIVFFTTPDRSQVVSFYQTRLDADRWLEQEGGCTILAVHDLLVGFCDGTVADTDGTITIVRPDRGAVDAMYEQLSDVATAPPTVNDEFDIYQFFATDPDGRTIEVQTFLHSTPPAPSR